MNQNCGKWTPTTTFAFVKAYIELPQLWDSKHKYYRNLRQRINAHTKLSQQFHISLTDVKRKIKSLRSTYFQEVKKAKEKDYESNLVWFGAMKQIIGHHYERYDQQLEENLIEDNIAIKDEQLSKDCSGTFPEPLVDVLQVMVDRNQTKFKELPNRDDEFDTFGKHVANQLRQISIYRALNLQMKIQQLLTQERLNDIKEANESYNQINNQFSQYEQRPNI